MPEYLDGNKWRHSYHGYDAEGIGDWLPPKVLEAPRVNARINVDAIGPEATPPESNAMAVNICGQKKLRESAKR